MLLNILLKLCNNSDQTLFSNTLTFARSLGRCWKPRPSASVFNTSLGTYSILFYPITLEGRRGTTDEFATIPFHLDLFSAALVELAKSIPVHSLILSSHLFFCLPLFLFPFTRDLANVNAWKTMFDPYNALLTRTLSTTLRLRATKCYYTCGHTIFMTWRYPLKNSGVMW